MDLVKAIVCFAGTLIVIAIFFFCLDKILKRNRTERSVTGPDHTPDLKRLEHKVQELPAKILDSITGSISNQKGKLAELVAYISLKASYDRVIPLGGIVDFICLRFAKDGDPGTMDFIDIKNGISARLSPDQRQLSKLIKEQRIQFIKLKVSTETIKDALDDSSDNNTGPDPGV